ncbi:MAG: SWIM zinc finger family protein [Gemmataceae bacterium]
MNASPPPQPESNRTVRLARDPTQDGIAVFVVTAGGKSVFYTAREILCEIGGRGFSVHRMGIGSVYHVRIGDPVDSSCECLGYLRHGRCRHLLGLQALIQAGKL